LEIEGAFSEMRRWRPDAIVVLTSGSSILHMSRIIDLTSKSKLPTIYGVSFAAASGALVGYGPDSLDQMVHAAMFVDEILKGAKPADLPIRQPTKFRLAINLATAKALGLSIPQSFLLRADDIVE
jgi:putative ABC transport system substrate-binding protein